MFSFSTGVYTFGLFTVDIFVNAGQVVTGNLAPYFLTVCKPNYTALGCQQALRYISHQEACTGNQDDILRARKTFPSKEAALSVYAALYLAVSLSALPFRFCDFAFICLVAQNNNNALHDSFVNKCSFQRVITGWI